MKIVCPYTNWKMGAAANSPQKGPKTAIIRNTSVCVLMELKHVKILKTEICLLEYFVAG